MTLVVLRTHHGVCMQSFVRKGYNKIFIENFSNIMKFFNSNPLYKCIKLTNSCDHLCEYCPNKLYNNKCKYEKFVQYLDNSYQAIFNFDRKRQYSFQEINYIVKNNLNINIFETICSNCKWFYICKKSLKKIM
ncbi:MAG: DUF1284 domain-containing protein [Alphaproteobacteria bacterium]|nr:DUF1284 domain-containing protein [Alphaproteobacteria bacterium]